MEFDTALLHDSVAPEGGTGATIPPIYQVSAFAHESAEKLEKVFNNKSPGFAYTRISNPTVTAFENRIAKLEGGVAAVACSSGMAAISMAILNIVQSGDEIIASPALFGGTIDLFDDLVGFGIKTIFPEEFVAEEIDKLITDKTKLIFTEIIGNPKLDVVDLESLSAVAKKHKIPLIVDSTTATPLLIKPFEFGADIVIHSSSKYINGNGSAVSGVIIDSGKFNWNFEKYKGLEPYKKFGYFAYISKLRNGIWRNFGSCLSPMNAFLNNVGIETMALRMERICYNALELAKALEKNENIVAVNYPGLESSPWHKFAEKQFKNGMAGGILTIRAGSKEKAFKLINNLKYATNATNIGDVRTLVIHAASTIYTHSSEESKKSAGVYDDLIRVSVGIEDIKDLIEDFTQAIAKANE